MGEGKGISGELDVHPTAQLDSDTMLGKQAHNFMSRVVDFHSMTILFKNVAF